MGGLDVGAQPAGGGKKQGVLHHVKKRVGIAIDMTPMVDIAFLLLIFFIVTTVFRLPQAMELNLPPKDAEVEVAESNVLMHYDSVTDRSYTGSGRISQSNPSSCPASGP